MFLCLLNINTDAICRLSFGDILFRAHHTYINNDPTVDTSRWRVRLCSLWPIYYSLVHVVETNDTPRSSTMLVLPGCYCCTVIITTVH